MTRSQARRTHAKPAGRPTRRLGFSHEREPCGYDRATTSGDRTQERSTHETHRHRHRARPALPTPRRRGVRRLHAAPVRHGRRHLPDRTAGSRLARETPRTSAVSWPTAASAACPWCREARGRGWPVPPSEPVCMVDFTRYMNKILEVAPDGSWARVQPGVVMGVLNASTSSGSAPSSLPTPPARTTAALGGMIANNSSGGRSVAYGGTKDHVLALEVVLHGGEVFRATARWDAAAPSWPPSWPIKASGRRAPSPGCCRCSKTSGTSSPPPCPAC